MCAVDVYSIRDEPMVHVTDPAQLTVRKSFCKSVTILGFLAPAACDVASPSLGVIALVSSVHFYSKLGSVEAQARGDSEHIPVERQKELSGDHCQNRASVRHNSCLHVTASAEL